MHFTIVTLFPEFFTGPLGCGLLARAQERGLVSFSLVNPRDFALDKHRTVDDRPYGGGPGMVMGLDTLVPALESIKDRGETVLLAPSGQPLSHGLAQELARMDRVTLICGRYEGLDARLGEIFPLRSVSVGDFVLNGGEAAAMCVIEAASRLIPGFMGHEESAGEESFSTGLLEYPHYTRPEKFQGRGVPDVLTSGDHAKIADWRRKQALWATLQRRPELLASARLTTQDMAWLTKESERQGRTRLGRNLYLALLHHPVLNKQGQVTTVSLTNLDLHDIARCSLAYDLGGFFVATPLQDQQRLISTLCGHWVEGRGRQANPDRANALSMIRLAKDLEEILAQVEELAGKAPRIFATSARNVGETGTGDIRALLETEPVLLLLGTASGLAPEVMDRAEGCLRPVRFLDKDNHLSVRTATAVMVDRIVSDTL
ncbi:MAG: tRNA (guanosine(37)-N1)-methyltransferase TrmD [Desulfovibrio sp.]|nr:MAG: tRNA (guanosine(37)-N1)-methyltransferase TrmD [Desulfovibrio sp.]